MNVELLRRVQGKILEEPEKFHMKTWAGWGDCGTTACIGGWACILSGKVTPAVNLASPGNLPDIVLGLSNEEGSELFYGFAWPDKYRVPYENAPDAPSRARVAADYIDHFITQHGGAR